MKKIELNFKVQNMRITTMAKLTSKKTGKVRLYPAIIDTGAHQTTISKELFASLGQKEQDAYDVVVRGIKGATRGRSTIIDNFVLGEVDLGKTRITVMGVEREFENAIILGMNILAWFNISVSHYEKKITLVERQFKTFDTESRFYRKDIRSLSVLSSSEDEISSTTYP